MSQYKDRRPWALEPHYSTHVGAMIEEELHDKSDIAAELAVRDKEIAELKEVAKRDCINFFYWWWNQPGGNTEQGYESWVAQGRPNTNEG